MAETDKVKIVTTIASFEDVQKSLQEVENKINGLIKSVNDVSEKEKSETEGKSGDINITRNADGTYGLETCTDEGWKKMFVSNKTTTGGTSEVYLADKPKIGTKLNTTENESWLTSSADPRYLTVTPDYKSDWIYVAQTSLTYNSGTNTPLTFTHNLGSLPSVVAIQFAPKDSSLSFNTSISGSHGDTVADSNIDYFVLIETGHHGSSASGEQRYGVTTLISKTVVYMKSGFASICRIPTNMTGAATAGSDEMDEGAIRILLWK